MAGEFAFALFAIGIIGTGLLAVPVLAGSTAFAVGDTCGWTCGLEHKVKEAKGFYSVIATATMIGIGISWSGIPPIKALFWSAVINGFVAVPIMAVMMILVSRRRTMGRLRASPTLLALGWAGTLVMAAAAAAMIVWR